MNETPELWNNMRTSLNDMRRWPLLGLDECNVVVSDDLRDQAIDMLGFVNELFMQYTNAGSDRIEALPNVERSPVSWQRTRFRLRPVHWEKVTIVPGSASGISGQVVDIRQDRPGEVSIGSETLKSGSLYCRNHLETWQNWAASEALDAYQGGLCVNVLNVPHEALASGEIDLRPMVLHGLDRAGNATDNGRDDWKCAIANAFWQTFWATGAHRQQRGRTFPVAFYPIDRTQAGEFDEPWRERYVSLRRRLFGRTSIMAYVLECLAASDALIFDTTASFFQVRETFDGRAFHLSATDIETVVAELNRTGFYDSFIHKTPSDEAPKHVTIKRIVPYAGCAFLSDVFTDTDALVASGKIQTLDGEILAATNSTFFLNFPEEYYHLHSAMNDPVSALVEDGQVHCIRTMRRATFLVDSDGKPSITLATGLKLNSEVLVFEGESTSLSAWDKSHKSFRENTIGPLFFGSVVVGDGIVETFEEIKTDVPMNGWAIGDSEAFGGEIDPRHAAEVSVPAASGLGLRQVRHAMAVGPMLLSKGEIQSIEQSREEFRPIVAESPDFEEAAACTRTQLPAPVLECQQRGVPPMRFPWDWDKTRAPRTAIGIRENGDVALVVVDGRANLAHSVGATLHELALIMKALGCRDAMNMDGGGSSVMFVKHPEADSLKLRPSLKSGVVNLPSDGEGVERLLPVPLVIVKRTPAVTNSTPAES